MIRALVHLRPQLLCGAIIGAVAASIVALPSISSKLALCALLAALPLLAWMAAPPERWLYAWFGAALLLPPLPIELGDSGPHVAMIFALAGLWIGLLRAGEWRLRMDALATALSCFLLALAASVAIAAIYSGIIIAAGSLARVLLFGIAIYVFFFLRDGPSRLDRGWLLLRMLFFAAAGSALFACVDFYFQFPAPAGFGPQFLWLESGVFRRAQGVFYEASTLGNMCAFFLVMIAVVFTRPRTARPVSAAALIAAGTVFASALVLSYSRASLVNFAIAMVALVWLQRKNTRAGRWLAAGVIAGALGVGLIIAAFPVFTTAYGLRLADSIQYFAESPNAVLSGRLAIWQSLAGFLIAHPWYALLGVGFKTLAYSNFTGAITVADNTYLSVLVETGIAGFAALIVLNLAILRAAHRAARCADPLRSFCGTCLFCFWCGQIVQMFSADLLTYWRVLPIYFSVLALADRE
jgi:O-antigen ligase